MKSSFARRHFGRFVGIQDQRQVVVSSNIVNCDLARQLKPGQIIVSFFIKALALHRCWLYMLQGRNEVYDVHGLKNRMWVDTKTSSRGLSRSHQNCSWDLLVKGVWNLLQPRRFCILVSDTTDWRPMCTVTDSGEVDWIRTGDRNDACLKRSADCEIIVSDRIWPEEDFQVWIRT